MTALNATIGNAATARLLRQTGLATPESPVHPVDDGVRSLDQGPRDFVSIDPPPAMPKDVAAELIAVRATLSKVPRLAERDQATLRKAIPGAPILDLITRRNERRDWLENLPAMIGALSPPAGQPDDSVAYQIHSLQQSANVYRTDLEGLQKEIDAHVRRAGAASEQELAKLIEDEFPKMFIERGKAIAASQLADNLKIAETEAARYGVEQNPNYSPYGNPYGGSQVGGMERTHVPGRPKPEDAAGLRAAAGEVLAKRKVAEDLWDKRVVVERRMEDEYEIAQSGRPDPVWESYNAWQAAFDAEHEAFDRLALQYPILYKVDLGRVVGASDEELSQHVCDRVVTLAANIEETRENIRDGDLEVWNLRGIVDLTMIDLGIDKSSPLVGVVEAHIREATADQGMLDKALMALQITAALVATFASGGLALVAGGVALGVGAHQLAGAVEDYMVESAASNVALDPAIADISVNEPRLMPIVIGVVSLGLDGLAVTKAITALRGPARALLSDGDLPSFSAAAYRALPRADADRLIQRAALLPEVTARAAAGTAPRGTAWTVEQIQDLFARAFKRPGPPQSGIVLHQTQASYDAALATTGLPPNTAGFFAPASEAAEATGDVVAAMGTIHLPPTASTLTVMHESLHAIGRQSGVREILGSYVEEGLTELLARQAFGPEVGRFIYDGNQAFVQMLGNEIGIDVLRNAYLHGRWAPLRSALRARLGGDAPVEHFYRLLRQVGPEGQRGGVLDEASEMLWPGGRTP